MSNVIASSQVSLIVGLGVTGWAVARFLTERNQRFVVADADINEQRLQQFKDEFPGVNVLLGELDCRQWHGVNEVILSPGVPRAHPAIVAALAEGIPVIGDIELFARNVSAPVIAITGSNGKTTVTTLLGEMAQQAQKKVAVGGNIGTPALELLAEDVQLYILELSSFQLESTSSLKPLAASILNVTADHLDRYDNFQQYHSAKQRIYFGCEKVVVNRDDLLSHPPIASHAQVIQFGLREPDLKDFGVRIEDNREYLAHGLHNIIAVEELLILGKHNQANALAALALGYAAGLDEAAMLRALTQFKGLPHRCEYVAKWNSVSFVNDSKATNVGATQAAINGLSGQEKNIVLIAGGEGKGADFTPLARSFNQHVKALVTMGADGDKISQIAMDSIPHSACSSLSEAVLKATDYAAPGDIVLLSPACASFDMFKNYQDRGQQFRQLVEALCR